MENFASLTADERYTISSIIGLKNIICLTVNATFKNMMIISMNGKCVY